MVHQALQNGDHNAKGLPILVDHVTIENDG